VRARLELDLVLGADDVDDRVDQRQVRKCLREVTQLTACDRVDLLGVQRKRARQREQLLAQPSPARDLLDLG
jgi:hypothetical protein